MLECCPVAEHGGSRLLIVALLTRQSPEQYKKYIMCIMMPFGWFSFLNLFDFEFAFYVLGKAFPTKAFT